MKTFFKRLKIRHYMSTLVYLLAGVLWPSFAAVHPPIFLRDPLDTTILAICLWISVIGGLIQIFGYLSSQQGGKLGTLGVSIELVGLILISIAPIAYVVAFVGVIFFSTVTAPAEAASILILVVTAIYLNRAVILIPRFRYEANHTIEE